MPASLVSHQGIVLPLKIKYPELFDGTALCVGSFAPDFDLFLRGFRLFHSLGSLVYTLPLSLLLVILLDKILLPRAAFAVKKRRMGVISQLLAFLGLDRWHVLQRKQPTCRWLVKAIFSTLVGILSHFLLDLPTHDWYPYLRPFYDGLMPAWFLQVFTVLDLPVVGRVVVSNDDMLWVLFSVGFGLLALYCLRYMMKHRLLMKWYPESHQSSQDLNDTKHSLMQTYS